MSVRLGFIGVGGAAREHIKNVAQISDAQIVAVCDVAPESAKQVGEQYRCNYYVNYQDMLDAEALDAVYVCTPPFARGAPEIAAARRGLNLFLEKPVALDLATAREVGEAIRTANVIASVGYVYRYQPSVERAREALSGRTIGLALGQYLTSMVSTAWWRERAKSGGQLVEQATHIVDAMRYLVGDVSTVAAQIDHRVVQGYPGMDIDDVSAMTMRFTNGAVGQLVCTCAGVPGYSSAGVTVFAEGVVVELLATTGVRIRQAGRMEEIQHSGFSAFRPEDEAFVQTIKTGDRSLVRSTFDDAVETLKTTLAAGESSRSGTMVRLDSLTS